MVNPRDTSGKPEEEEGQRSVPLLLYCTFFVLVWPAAGFGCLLCVALPVYGCFRCVAFIIVVMLEKTFNCTFLLPFYND